MNQNYPGIFIRIKAAFVDAVFLIIVSLAASDIFSNLPDSSEYLRAFFYILIFFLYEPLMVSISGATIGHQIFKIKVRRVNTNKKINLFQAILRFVSKALLGWVSFFTMITSKKNQAIHDEIANSIVVFDN